ncbi:OLC1v1001694C2 [Oldenlandia corymbosa var. corymbosa]|nr:OLC1v1001694C2 [Oldenlandia corymbosa var. corymbosa]
MEAILDNFGGILFKVGLFVLVQALVYLILSQSSSVFSKTQRSFSFKPARSISIRRMAAALADMPAGGEPSPTTESPGRYFAREKSTLQRFESFN